MVFENNAQFAEKFVVSKKKLMNDESPSVAKVKLAILLKMINLIEHYFLEMKRKYEKRCKKWWKDNTVWKFF